MADAPASSSRRTMSRSSTSGDAPGMNGWARSRPRYRVERSISAPPQVGAVARIREQPREFAATLLQVLCFGAHDRLKAGLAFERAPVLEAPAVCRTFGGVALLDHRTGVEICLPLVRGEE